MFIAVSILGGALVQYPIGIASDRIDRRHVLTFLCAMSSLRVPLYSNRHDITAYRCRWGASNSLYAVSLAKAADNSERDEFVMIGSRCFC